MATTSQDNKQVDRLAVGADSGDCRILGNLERDKDGLRGSKVSHRQAI